MEILVRICPAPRRKEADGGMFLLIYCLLFHTQPPPPKEEGLSIEVV